MLRRTSATPRKRAWILRPADPRSATQPERYPSMFARSLFAFRILPLVMATACAALLLPAANVASAAEASFRQMTVTASRADDRLAHFALYYPTPDAARVIRRASR